MQNMNFPACIIGMRMREQTKAIFSNYLYRICGCNGDWQMSSFITKTVAELKEQIQELNLQERVQLCGVCDDIKKELEKISFNKCTIPVIKNLNGEQYCDSDNMVEILSNHVINPVKFRKSIETMLDMGIDTFVEIGPGKTLSGFVKKVCKDRLIDVNILNIENMETLKNSLDILTK